MTPDKARALLEGAAPGEWQWDETGNVAAVDRDGWEDVADYVSEEDAALIVAAPEMAAMIAGMREEYAIAYLDRDGNIDLMDEGYETLAAAQRPRAHLLAKVRPYTKIMRRAVGEWEEA